MTQPHRDPQDRTISQVTGLRPRERSRADRDPHLLQDIQEAREE